MITIKCLKCNKKLFKYIKIGKGKLLHCWKDRIVENYSLYQNKKIFCDCGNLIGEDQENYIKLKKNSIVIKGLKD
jgi:hypothetical protein